MTCQQIQHLIGFGKNACYNSEAKAQFEKLALKLLREVRSVLGGNNNSDISVRFNPGGIAVSGDAILHSASVYIQISGYCLGEFKILVRACDSRSDYIGKANHYYRIENLMRDGANGLAAFARDISENHQTMNWSKSPVCDTCGNRVSSSRTSYPE